MRITKALRTPTERRKFAAAMVNEVSAQRWVAGINKGGVAGDLKTRVTATKAKLFWGAEKSPVK